MKKLFFFLSILSMSSLATAQYCSIDGFSNGELRLQNYQRSQAATSFNISCDKSYSILFNSRNLMSADGMSFVSNGPERLRTKLHLSGANNNLWGVPLNQGAAQRQKYIIAVQLIDNPLSGVPAGTYTDQISVDINF
ncbi:hypothetical protein BS636_02975 [Acinetobacter sp. LoGeW2-3]|uniref:hypothetical protein n=1 Tax=Acinetobacter sp. LoGeW2-3 TaxID=1808001 RepID=UPI000C05A039|nr:hypothetical protein [Acinetobacter sp. LoGeW2-3]ATO18696.1 hypothetical protein BS636_02975 [Acinetobacter sp. LoGeW2-3]